jgi:hypothetical protein
MLRWGSPGRDGADIDDAHRGTGLPTMAAVGCSARAWSKASCNLASLANTTEAAPITANPMRMPIQATMRAKELMRVTVTFREREIGLLTGSTVLHRRNDRFDGTEVSPSGR